MSIKRPAGSGKKLARPGGFWTQAESRPGIVSVRHSSSRLAGTLAFLRRVAGWDRKND